MIWIYLVVGLLGAAGVWYLYSKECGYRTKIDVEIEDDGTIKASSLERVRAWCNEVTGGPWGFFSIASAVIVGFCCLVIWFISLVFAD